MKILVPSCAPYADAWPGFMGCLRHFWHNCPYPVFFVTDPMRGEPEPPAGAFSVAGGFDDGPRSWSRRLATALLTLGADEPVLLMQEDFFLSSSVAEDVVLDACVLLSRPLSGLQPPVGCVRLFPCPGSDGANASSEDLDIDTDGFGFVTRSADYRVSCQAAVWRPEALLSILMVDDVHTAADFEIVGTHWSRRLRWTFLAWQRELKPWPLEYICSAISRGRWNPDAIALCKRLGIELDISRRPIDA